MSVHSITGTNSLATYLADNAVIFGATKSGFISDEELAERSEKKRLENDLLAKQHELAKLVAKNAADSSSNESHVVPFGKDALEDFKTVGAFVNYLHMEYEEFAALRECTLAVAAEQSRAETFKDAPKADKKDPMVTPTQEGWALLNLFTNEIGFDAGTGRAVKLLDPECPGMSRESLKRWADSQYGAVCGMTAGHLACKASVSEMWWGGMTQKTARIYRKRTFDPTNVKDDFHSDVYNTWHALRRTMARPDMTATFADVKIFDDHLTYLSGYDRETVNYIWDYLATVYQKPDEKIPVALAFVSPHRGTGKSMVGVAIKWVWGGAMVKETGGEALWATFDCDFVNCVFTVLEELPRRTKVSGVDDLGKFNRITSAIRTSLKEKHIPARVYRTPHLVITTNEMDSLPLTADDRRLCPALCFEAPKEQAYYDRLGVWIGKTEPGYGIPKLAGYLATRDVSKFKIDQRPPMTSAKQRLTADNLSERATWLRGKIEDGLKPFDRDMAYTRQLLDDLKMFKDDHEYSRLMFTEKTLLPALREIREGAVFLGRMNEKATNPRYMMLCWRHMMQWRAEGNQSRLEYVDSKDSPRPFDVITTEDRDDE